MRWFKIVGLVLLSLGGMLCGVRMNERFLHRLKQTKACLSLLQFIKTEVECFSRPISEILKSCEPSLLCACGYAREDTPKSLNALLVNIDFSDNTTGELMGAFCEEFGNCYREEQIERCSYYCGLLEKRRAELSEELPKRKRLNMTLFISGSLGLAILLL